MHTYPVDINSEPISSKFMNWTVQKHTKLSEGFLVSQPQTQSRKLPSWVTGFGAQVIAGLIIGLILGFIASKMDASLPADDEKGSWLTQTLTGVGLSLIHI